MVDPLRPVLTRLRAFVADRGVDGPTPVLAAVALGWALSIGVRFVYPALVPLLRAEFGFGLSAVGLLLSLLWPAA